MEGLAFAALTLHWFNPLVWLAFALAGQDMETACDEAVVRRMDGPARADYAATLLQLATGRRVGLPLAFGAGDPARRVRHLARWKRPARWVILAAAAVCAAAAVALLTNPASAQAPEDFGASPSEAPLSPGSTYVSYQCIYWNPAGSQLRSDDTGVRYVVGEDDFTLVSRSGALPGPETPIRRWTPPAATRPSSPASPGAGSPSPTPTRPGPTCSCPKARGRRSP